MISQRNLFIYLQRILRNLFRISNTQIKKKRDQLRKMAERKAKTTSKTVSKKLDNQMKSLDNLIFAFLSRSYHESIKTKAASVTHKITVADKGITAEEEID